MPARQVSPERDSGGLTKAASGALPITIVCTLELGHHATNQMLLSASQMIARWGRWLLWTFPLFSSFFRRRALRGLLENVAEPETLPHLLAALSSPDRVVVDRAGQALLALPEAVSRLSDALISTDLTLAARADALLRRLDDPVMIDAVCARWMATRGSSRGRALGELITACGFVATAPPAVRVYTALLTGLAEVLSWESEVLSALCNALDDEDDTVRANSESSLRSSSEPAVMDAVLDRA